MNGVKTTENILPSLQAQVQKYPNQLVNAGKDTIARQNLPAKEFSAISNSQFEQAGNQYLANAGSQMFLSLKTNPVEFAGLITAIAGLFFVILFGFKTEIFGQTASHSRIA